MNQLVERLEHIEHELKDIKSEISSGFKVYSKKMDEDKRYIILRLDYLKSIIEKEHDYKKYLT